MIHNVEELLAEAEKHSDIEERTRFIMNYFLENVKYNYAYLLASGYARGTATGFSKNSGIVKNKTRAPGDSEYALTRSIISGESRIFNDILRIRDDNSGNYDNFIKELESYLTTELKSHLGNDTLVAENVDKIMRRIERKLREKRIVNFKGNNHKCNYDISWLLIDLIEYGHDIFPPEFENDLITNGVCADYTKYIVPILKQAGIEAHNVRGRSELGHAWIIIRNGEEYKSVDLTRAVIIRDGFIGIPQEQTSEDWLYSDLEDMFRMQETRTITHIDGKRLPHVINGQNYDRALFFRMMNGQDISDSTLRNRLLEGLRRGITATDISNAEKAERIEEREVKNNE